MMIILVNQKSKLKFYIFDDKESVLKKIFRISAIELEFCLLYLFLQY